MNYAEKDMSDDKWTDWYVIHSYKRGMPRLMKKPTGHEVEGQAGSVSNSVQTRNYQTDRIENKNVIRFTEKWVAKNKDFLSRHFTLEEYLEQKWVEENPDQVSLEEFF